MIYNTFYLRKGIKGVYNLVACSFKNTPKLFKSYYGGMGGGGRGTSLMGPGRKLDFSAYTLNFVHFTLEPCTTFF